MAIEVAKNINDTREKKRTLLQIVSVCERERERERESQVSEKQRQIPTFENNQTYSH